MNLHYSVSLEKKKGKAGSFGSCSLHFYLKKHLYKYYMREKGEEEEYVCDHWCWHVIACVIIILGLNVLMLIYLRWMVTTMNQLDKFMFLLVVSQLLVEAKKNAYKNTCAKVNLWCTKRIMDMDKNESCLRAHVNLYLDLYMLQNYAIQTYCSRKGIRIDKISIISYYLMSWEVVCPALHCWWLTK